MFKNNDLSFLIENVSIQKYAEDIIGITEWTSKGEYVKPRLKYVAPDSNDFSSLSINLEENYFVRFSGKGRTPKGNIINFIMNTEDCERDEAIRKLLDYSNAYLGNIVDKKSYSASVKEFRKNIKKDVNVEFRLPLRYKNNKRLIFYMIDCRKINKSIIYYMLDNNLMYQSWDCKGIFVSYENDVPVFACVRDTNWNERITYGVKGSKVEHGWYIDNKSTSLVVTEAVVDAMAYMSILDIEGSDYKRHNYLALTGCSKLMCIEHHLNQDKNINEIFLAFDADKAGDDARVKAKELLKKIGFTGKVHDVRAKHGKDINDELKYIKTERKITD